MGCLIPLARGRQLGQSALLAHLECKDWDASRSVRWPEPPRTILVLARGGAAASGFPFRRPIPEGGGCVVRHRRWGVAPSWGRLISQENCVGLCGDSRIAWSGAGRTGWRGVARGKSRLNSCAWRAGMEGRQGLGQGRGRGSEMATVGVEGRNWGHYCGWKIGCFAVTRLRDVTWRWQ